MEDFSTEIISLITETFDDDQDLIAKMLLYLYSITMDDEMMLQIEYWFEHNHRCLGCGGIQQSYFYHDWNTDKDTTVWLCNKCNRARIEDIKENGGLN